MPDIDDVLLNVVRFTYEINDSPFHVQEGLTRDNTIAANTFRNLNESEHPTHRYPHASTIFVLPGLTLKKAVNSIFYILFSPHSFPNPHSLMLSWHEAVKCFVNHIAKSLKSACQPFNPTQKTSEANDEAGGQESWLGNTWWSTVCEAFDAVGRSHEFHPSSASHQANCHLLTGDLDTTSEPNFVECYLASNVDGNQNGRLGQDGPSATHWRVGWNILKRDRNILWGRNSYNWNNIEYSKGSMELAQIVPSRNCPYLSMRCGTTQRKAAWQKRPWHRRRRKGGRVGWIILHEGWNGLNFGWIELIFAMMRILCIEWSHAGVVNEMQWWLTMKEESLT